MPKQKNKFEVSRIRKNKKALPRVKHNWLKKLLRRYDTAFRHAALVLVAIAGMWVVYHYQEYGAYLFKASVLETPPPFTGTVFPVDKVPDWTNWDGDNHTDKFSFVSPDMLVPLPAYDLSKMQFPNDQLKWGNSQHDLIRNTKITYPVVYLGDYELDHEEGRGSHLAVDIKMPVGTPVKSIANGRVIKVDLTESGFGHHVVIEHRNVPSLEDENKKTTYYSAFNHMDQIHVKEGEAVSKGQVIGTSGNTGTSTTPHLHFQIDTTSAPWHPYWPFSWAESQAAGLSFFEAVNAGLGLDSAKQNTINPMQYVAKYLNDTGGPVDSGVNGDPDSNDHLPDDNPPADHQENPPSDSQNSQNSVNENPPVETLDEPDESAVDTSLFAFKITSQPVSMVNNGVTVTATDESGQIEKMSATNEVRINVSGVGRVSKKSFRKVDFNGNSISFVVNSSETGTARVEVGKTVFNVDFIEAVQPIASLAVEHDGNYQKGQVEVIKLIALDINGKPTPVVNFGGTIEVTAKEGQAKFVPDRVTMNDFKNGIAEVRMTVPNEQRVVVRAHGGAIVGESEPIYAEPLKVFGDVDKNNPHYDAIKYLEEYNIIGGYSDGTFKPEKTVNRVEALKMLMLAFNVEVPLSGTGQLPFSDTDNGAWYSSTLATAVNKAIVKGYDDGTFKPGNTVNKAEYLKMLFLTGGIQPGADLDGNPYSDVPKNTWYAPFAYLTNKQNLLDVPNNRLQADKGMTRGDVAETIYRLKYIQDHNLVTFAK
jgi:hypothetical protein